MIRGVLFDFGGVFTDSPFAAFARYADSIGATREQIDSIVFGGYGDDGDHPWHRVERGEITLEAAREGILALGSEHGLVVDIWQVFLAMSENQGGLRSDLVEHVRHLRTAGLKTGIVTNNIVEFREHWRAMLPVAELFDVVVDSSEVGVRKPGAAIFQLALDPVPRVVAVDAVAPEDDLVDALAGRADAVGVGADGGERRVGEDPSEVEEDGLDRHGRQRRSQPAASGRVMAIQLPGFSSGLKPACS